MSQDDTGATTPTPRDGDGAQRSVTVLQDGRVHLGGVDVEPGRRVTVSMDGEVLGVFTTTSAAEVGEWSSWRSGHVEQLPLTGMTVWYRTEPHGAIAPAIVLATTATLDVAELRTPPLDSDQRVHLLVMAPLRHLGPGDSALYHRWNVAHDEDEGAAPGTWCWAPVGVSGEQL